MTKIIVAVCLGGVAISALVFISSTRTGNNNEYEDNHIVDSLAIESAIVSYTNNKYVQLDIVALLLASDERYLTDENKDILVAMHQYVQSNPQLHYASSKTKINLERLTPFGDSTVYDASVEELDFNAVSKIALLNESVLSDDLNQENQKLIQKFVNVIISNDTLPTVLSNSRYAVVRSKCNLKIYPISN
ncbi:MAG: hypothetical protein ABJH04_07325 [Cyclobacteriaceae bacterium]